MIASPSLTTGPKVIAAPSKRLNGQKNQAKAAPANRIRPPRATRSTTERITRLKETPIAFIDNEGFRDAKCMALADEPALVQEVEQGSNESHALSLSMPAHLARLCATPLLSVEEERGLFRRMNYCKFSAAELLKGLQRSVKKADAAEQHLRQAERLRNYLVQANTRLVMSIARGFADNRNSFDDLLSQGIASLMHAVEKFDFDRGYRFSTYATCAVRRDLFRMVMGVKKDGQRYSTGAGELLDNRTDYRAEDEGISEGSWNSLSHSIGQMMEHLDDRERLIVTARFGLGEESGKTSYSKLGDRLGISKERVRQLANRALDKLRELAPEHRLESLLA